MKALAYRWKKFLRLTTSRADMEMEYSVDVVRPAEGKKLIEFLISQAMLDRMLALSAGVKSDDGEPWLRYYGYPKEKKEPIWWHMIPPRAYTYPAMIQCLLRIASLEPRMPLEGTIPAVRAGKKLSLRVKFCKDFAFQIEWDKDEVAFCG